MSKKILEVTGNGFRDMRQSAYGSFHSAHKEEDIEKLANRMIDRFNKHLDVCSTDKKVSVDSEQGRKVRQSLIQLLNECKAIIEYEQSLGKTDSTKDVKQFVHANVVLKKDYL